MSTTSMTPFSDFLSNVPPALTLALVDLGPGISACKTAIQISSWSTSWHHSWLALAVWWALCLFLDITLRYVLCTLSYFSQFNFSRRFLPLVVVALVVLAQQRQTHHLQPPVTEHALRTIISDLTIIQSLLPSIPPPSIAIPTLFRVVAILYIPYIVLSFFVSLRVLCAIVGTVIFTWRAPWVVVLRSIIWRSAWFRWLGYGTWALLSGEPLPPPTMSFRPSNHSYTPVQSFRFLFTIYENQRWWMGLDWTAALLPGERPSWCSALQQPLSPPNAFSLPENTTVYLSDNKGGRLKRTATWKWEEPEWRVLVHKDGGGLSRVERPLPTVREESPNSSRLLKAAGRMNSTSTADTTKSTAANSETDHVSDGSEDPAEEELLTDVDGWVYGDNKWENQSHRGGLGKVIPSCFSIAIRLDSFFTAQYTRYRRWTRIAVVFEEVEGVPVGDLGIQKENASPPTFDPTPASDPSSESPELIIGNPPDTPLRQRIRMALNKGSESQSPAELDLK